MKIRIVLSALIFAAIVALIIWSIGLSSSKSHEAPALAHQPAASNQELIQMGVDDVVESRQAAFYLSAMAMSRIKVGQQQVDDFESLQYPAAILSQWARALPKMFPQGSHTEASKALETVWTDREGFERHAEEYARLTAELSVIARTSHDREAFSAKRLEVVDSCNACHDRYHVPD